jgi:hypothetical protein
VSDDDDALEPLVKKSDVLMRFVVSVVVVSALSLAPSLCLSVFLSVCLSCEWS